MGYFHGNLYGYLTSEYGLRQRPSKPPNLKVNFILIQVVVLGLETSTNQESMLLKNTFWFQKNKYIELLISYIRSKFGISGFRNPQGDPQKAAIVSQNARRNKV